MSYPTIRDYFESSASVVDVSHLNALLDSTSLYDFKEGSGPTDGIRKFGIDSGAETSVVDHDTLFGAADPREIIRPIALTYEGKLLMTTKGFSDGSRQFTFVDPASSWAIVDQWNTSGGTLLPSVPLHPAAPKQMAPGSIGGLHAVACSPDDALSNPEIYFMIASGSTLQCSSDSFAVDEARVSCGYTAAGMGKFYHVGYGAPTFTAALGIYETTFTAGGVFTTVKLGTIAMSAIDAGWTSINGVSNLGYHVDDGKLLMYAYGNGGSGSYYLVKIDPATCTVVWTSALNNTPTTLPYAFSIGIIQGNSFGYVGNRTLYDINLTDGTSTTTSLSVGGGMTISESYFDYPSNSIIVEGQIVDFTGLTPVGSTTTHATAQWYRIQLGDAPVVPPVSTGGAPMVIGCAYTSRAQLLRPDFGNDAGSQAGPAFGKLRSIHQYGAYLFRTRDITFGTSFDAGRQVAANLFTADTPETEIGLTELLTGIISNTLDDHYSWTAQIAWEQTRPTPGTILAISGYIETSEK
jgi:hypothetical protein